MKKLILLLILCAIPVAWAADLSFTISFTIPSAKVDAIREGYLKAKPVPQELSDPNDPNSPMVDTMTAKQWILGNAAQAAKDHIKTTYNRGRDQIDKESRVKDPFSE